MSPVVSVPAAVVGSVAGPVESPVVPAAGVRAARQARAAGLAAALGLLAVLPWSASAAPTVLAESLPQRSALAGEQSDAAVAPGASPVGGFQLGAAASLTSLVWWGYDLAGLGGPDAFRVTLNGSEVQGAVTSAADPVDIDPGVNVLRYTFTPLSPVAMLAGPATLGVVNDSLSVEWYWQKATALPGAAAPMSLRVWGEARSGVVPEPGMLALVMVALGAAGIALRRPVPVNPPR